MIPTAIGGVLRAFGSTARGLALDLAAGAASAGELATSAIGARRDRGLSDTGARGPGYRSRRRATVRVRVLILSDEDGRPLTITDRLTGSLDLADSVFTAHAGIRVRCEQVDTITEPAPPRALDPRSNQGLLLDDVLGRTAFYRRHLAPRSPLAVVGDPVTVIVVRQIAGRTTGCSLGMTADWVIVQGSLFDPEQPDRFDRTVLAHELGHALNLPHHRDTGNLMYPVSSPPAGLRGTDLRGWQAALLHANRHTIPPARG